jgi:hypothetical protein
MSDIPGLTLPWPEGEQAITPIAPMEPEPDAAATLAEAVAGLPGQNPSGAEQLADGAVPGRESVLAGGHLHLVWPAEAQLPERARDRGAFPPFPRCRPRARTRPRRWGRWWRAARQTAS